MALHLSSKSQRSLAARYQDFRLSTVSVVKMPANKTLNDGLEMIKNDPSKTLGLKLGTNSISTGQFVPRAEAQSPPELSFASPSPSTTYIAIAIDPDAPLPSFGILGPIMHWIQPGFKASAGTDTLTSSEPFVTNFIGPAPPPGSSAHRYVFFLYEQPAAFDAKQYAPADGKTVPNLSRMRFDLDAWASKAGLGQPVAVNYFMSK